MHVEFWLGSHKKKRRLERPGITSEDNIAVVYRGMDWIRLTQSEDRCVPLVNEEVNFWFP
jgi:hypothetical protein